ncbi:MAG TPA: hypothetical protein VE398_15190 [Acidobacteriota bacterium]|nr:hypothetical protein [Acidobacteriota bacterium]
MRKQIAALVLAAGMCLGLASRLTVAAMPAPQDDKMQSQDKMKDEKMKDSKMTGDKMKDEKMKKDKMEDKQ